MFACRHGILVAVMSLVLMGCGVTKDKSVLLMAGMHAEQRITANIWLDEHIKGPIVYASAPRCGGLPITPEQMSELYEILNGPKAP